MEFDSLAQLELPRQRIDRLPLGGESRLELRLLGALDEVAEDVRGDVIVRRQVVLVRIDRRDVGAKANREIGGLGRKRRGGKRDRGGGGDGPRGAQVVLCHESPSLVDFR